MASSQSSSRSSAAMLAPVIPLVDDDLLMRPQQEDQQEGEAAAAAAAEVRRGPWTVDEDHTLVKYISEHGEGRWNSLARAAGLKRTGKSCRLRWLNYLRPDVKRGNFTADEQLLILDLHSRWGNRWSKIAQHLPGRTDNEIKNYWRTRVQKHAKQLNCDANSAGFKDAMRCLWMPRLAADAAHLIGGDVDHHHRGYYDASTTTTATNGALLLRGMPATTITKTTTTPSSSDSFVTSSESFDDVVGGLCADVHGDNDETMMVINGGDCFWMQGANQGFCNSTDSKQQLRRHDEQSLQFQDQDLVGWVQGFSDGLSEHFWSLEDVWKMQ
ncbi:hypothetical protein GUJ93_ZPchr0012g20051 [Zizania palustris]|uniref:Uncharacterized protein n=1 Tax=Zizania palustris TaxID=103762 RepID=A0A8J5WRV0_ZIZPA|nr:hypothetical protein GUJ93_ZPchr0012g20051 [Zizania palustris]